MEGKMGGGIELTTQAKIENALSVKRLLASYFFNYNL